MMKFIMFAVTIVAVFCSGLKAEAVANSEYMAKPATRHTIEANKVFAKNLPWNDSPIKKTALKER